jgi:Right handed beta helix region
MNKLLLILAASMAIGLGIPAASAATTCKPVLTSGEDLTRAAATCPPSTTFTIKDGAYKLSGPVTANSGDIFKGVYSDGTRPKIDANGARYAFDVAGTNRVTIRGLSVTGTKGGNWCEPSCGGAIKGAGTNLHVLNVRIHHNPNQGIGNPGDGFLLQNSEIDHNGSYSFTSLPGNPAKEASSAAGVKITKGSATFRNNKIHHNYWIGIWCDAHAGPVIATGNNIHDNGKIGMKYEKCTGGAINDNSVSHNGYLNKGAPIARPGILLQSPQSVEVANNTFRDNRTHGIHAKHNRDRRKVFGVRIHHNSFRNDTLEGCHVSGVKCWANGK